MKLADGCCRFQIVPSVSGLQGLVGCISSMGVGFRVHDLNLNPKPQTRSLGMGILSPSLMPCTLPGKKYWFQGTVIASSKFDLQAFLQIVPED